MVVKLISMVALFFLVTLNDSCVQYVANQVVEGELLLSREEFNSRSKIRRVSLRKGVVVHIKDENGRQSSREDVSVVSFKDGGGRYDAENSNIVGIAANGSIVEIPIDAVTQVEVFRELPEERVNAPATLALTALFCWPLIVLIFSGD